MMNNIRAGMCFGFLVFCSPLPAQDVYRCDYGGNRTVYQGTQCEIGVQQKAIDPANAKREQIMKAQEQERLQRRQKSEAGTTAGSSGVVAAEAPASEPPPVARH